MAFKMKNPSIAKLVKQAGSNRVSPMKNDLSNLRDTINTSLDNPYSKESESGILFSDPSLNIDWKIREDELIISEKDKQLKTLNDFQS